MKAIQVQNVIGRITAKKDGSLGYSSTTPELTDEEKIEFMKLQGVVLTALYTPLDMPNAPKLVVDSDIKGKSLTSRLYSVLFVLWKQEGEPDGDFEIFRKKKMEAFIDIVKDQLE